MAAAEAGALRVAPAGSVAGELSLPGDKSISHRAVLVGAVCDGPVEVEGFGAGEDTRSTVRAVEALGVRVEPLDEGWERLRVHGVGLRGLKEAAGPIDVGNAGTLIRLLPGLLAGQPGAFTLDGDESIRRRPVDRVVEPLRRMGAVLEDDDGRPPLDVLGGRPLRAIDYTPPVASAQVKSCVLLAGLYAESGPTTVVEARPTRDHTERILSAAGARVTRLGQRVSVWPAERLHLDRVEVPGDLSSAAPFLVAATLLPESRLFLRGVGLNPGRTGILTVLERMGARIAVFNRRTTAGGEPVGDLEVRPAELVATDIGPDLVPSLVDELPFVALAACLARGRTTVWGAGELRLKESDRLATTAAALRRVGGHIEVMDDGWRIRGVPARLRGGRVEAAGDHRIAMLGAVAGLLSQDGVEVIGADAAAVSFPGFPAALEALVAAPG